METKGYINTFVVISADSPVAHSVVPQEKNSKKTAHLIEYELLHAKPYQYNHEELIYEVFIRKKGFPLPVSPLEEEEIKNELFSRGHPCLRASPLIKKHGFGAHYDKNGKIALYPAETEAYQHFLEDATIPKVPGMKAKR